MLFKYFVCRKMEGALLRILNGGKSMAVDIALGKGERHMGKAQGTNYFILHVNNIFSMAFLLILHPHHSLYGRYFHW